MKKNKYSAIKTIVNNIEFASRKEANYYNTLLLLKRAGEVTQIDLQPEFPYKMICVQNDDLTAPIFSKNFK